MKKAQKGNRKESKLSERGMRYYKLYLNKVEWDEFGAAAKSKGKTRSSMIRGFIRTENKLHQKKFFVSDISNKRKRNA